MMNMNQEVQCSWYEHEPESVVENENLKILWDFTIQCGHTIEATRPDIVVVDKVKKETMIIDVAIPGDTRACDKEREIKLVKRRNCQIMADEKGRALGTITTKFEKYNESLGIEIRIKHVQKSALLRTARIIRKVLFCYVPRKRYCRETFGCLLSQQKPEIPKSQICEK